MSPVPETTVPQAKTRESGSPPHRRILMVRNSVKRKEKQEGGKVLETMVKGLNLRDKIFVSRQNEGTYLFYKDFIEVL